MSAAELKELLIEKIQNIESEDVLIELYKLVDKESSSLNIYNLTVAEKSEIYQAKQQINTGQSLNNATANKEIEEWLKK